MTFTIVNSARFVHLGREVFIRSDLELRQPDIINLWKTFGLVHFLLDALRFSSPQFYITQVELLT